MRKGKLTISVGDHLLIKRGDKVIGPDDEAHHEYEVLETGYDSGTSPDPDTGAARSIVAVKLAVVL